MALINVNLGGRRRTGPRRRGPGAAWPRGRKPWWWSLVLLLIAGLSYLAKQQGWIGDAPSRADGRRPPTAQVERPSPGQSSGEDDLASLIRARRSGVVVESTGVVTKTLPDDSDGSRHQRFIVRVGDETVLIAHNIDLATRVPLKAGDEVRFRGEFEWNDRGGVIHWTHHDPARRRAGGWIELRGKRYQ